MLKVLLLTAAYGEGHNAAARGLDAALTELGVEAEIVDVFALTGGAYYEKSRRGYIELINRAPKVWAAVYALVHRVPIMAFSMPFMGAMLRQLRQILDEQKPATVVSVYPAYGYMIEKLFPNGRPFSFHTVVTDSITINSVWYRCASDTFIVPNEASAEVMRAAGVASAKVRTLGFPVAPKFSRDRPKRPEPQTPRVLYMINAGRDSAADVVRELLAIEPLHLTVTVGRDEELGERLKQVATSLRRPLELHGWTTMMPELLMTHHVLIGKAGGATVQETIAARTPMLLTQIVPGQEEGNARLLLENGCGALCETPASLASAIRQAFADGAAGWRKWEQNISALSRPAAAQEIAQFILDSAPPAA